MKVKIVARSHCSASNPILQTIKIKKTNAKGSAQAIRETTPHNKVTEASNSKRQMVLSGK
jgi:hypothetical protein